MYDYSQANGVNVFGTKFQFDRVPIRKKVGFIGRLIPISTYIYKTNTF